MPGTGGLSRFLFDGIFGDGFLNRGQRFIKNQDIGALGFGALGFVGFNGFCAGRCLRAFFRFLILIAGFGLTDDAAKEPVERRAFRQGSVFIIHGIGRAFLIAAFRKFRENEDLAFILIRAFFVRAFRPGKFVFTVLHEGRFGFGNRRRFLFRLLRFRCALREGIVIRGGERGFDIRKLHRQIVILGFVLCRIPKIEINPFPERLFIRFRCAIAGNIFIFGVFGGIFCAERLFALFGYFRLDFGFRFREGGNLRLVLFRHFRFGFRLGLMLFGCGFRLGRCFCFFEIFCRFLRRLFFRSRRRRDLLGLDNGRLATGGDDRPVTSGAGAGNDLADALQLLGDAFAALATFILAGREQGRFFGLAGRNRRIRRFPQGCFGRRLGLLGWHGCGRGGCGGSCRRGSRRGGDPGGRRFGTGAQHHVRIILDTRFHAGADFLFRNAGKHLGIGLGGLGAEIAILRREIAEIFGDGLHRPERILESLERA